MLESMKNEAAAQQLTLLPSSQVNARFQLSSDTRERGLRHVAEIRQMLAERRAAQDSSNVTRLRQPQSGQAA